ncbi:MAG TPA: ribonuclease [Sphingomicrobium sp.]|nr:ribonuclease [Sphingomicrobium sp.]
MIDEGRIVEARIHPDGVQRAGSVISARLTSVGSWGRNAVAVDEADLEYLLPRGAPGVTEGAPLTIEVTREAIPGCEPWKRPLAKLSDASPMDPPSLAGRMLTFPAARDELAQAGWNDVMDEARSGLVPFAGGELRISTTPAMTLIDVDGTLPPEELAVRGAAEAANAVGRLDIGGSIGIDLPTVGNKEARRLAAEAIDEHLPKPFERTAINGFGFVQIVRPRHRASLIELAHDRAPFEARALLRRAAFEAAGPKRLVAHPAVIAVLKARSNWTGALSRQVGGAVELRSDAALPISGGYAEKR